jgi:hypothetical protein
VPQHPFVSLPPWDYKELFDRVFRSLGFIVSYAHDVPDLLSLANSLDCADRRDKVYGIISIINWGNVAAITPDYTQSSFRTAVNFIRALAKLDSAGRAEKVLDLRYISYSIVSGLELDNNSQDVPDAIEARRGIPETIFTESKLQLEDPRPLEFTEATTWCLSADHLDRSRS